MGPVLQVLKKDSQWGGDFGDHRIYFGLGTPGEEVIHPDCATFNKNGVAPVTDSTTCRTACQTAEGLSDSRAKTS